MKYSINMLSTAHKVKGQGVLSAYNEQVSLITDHLGDKFEVKQNKLMLANIMHYHTINFRFYLSQPIAKLRGQTVGYVHFVPETIDNSLKLPKLVKPIFYRYIISFYKSMDELIVVNPYFIDVLSKYGIDKSKITYIPNYVCDTKFYEYSREQKEKIKLKFGIQAAKFTVVCSGQLQTRKGIFDFIELARRLPDIQFMWAGGFSFGTITNGYDEIKKVLNDPPHNLKFLGIIDRKDMNDFYNCADVMMLASYEELFPMTILEAMNCRIPILLRDIDIYEGILFDFYEKAKNVDEFEKVIKRLKTDSQYYMHAKENSSRGKAFYEKQNILTIWDEFYSNLVLKPSHIRYNSIKKSLKGKIKRGNNI